MTRFTSRAIVLACLFIVAACSSTATRVGSTTLKVTAWNIEHLAAADASGCRARSEADYAALRAHVSRLDADVIAFAEVENRAAAERVFDPARYAIVMSSRPDSGRSGFCGRDATDGPTIRKQDVGFAVRKGIQFTRNADLLELGLGNPDLRWGVDITVLEPAPVRLLSLHLKSGCSRGSSNPACPVLFDQVPVLQDWIAARAREDVPFVLLGDWNRRLALADDEVWRRLNEGNANLVEASAGRPATCIARYPEYIDLIVLDPRAAARMRPGSFEEFAYGVAEADYPSDHCPVSVTFDH
ncbi:MAG: endonuclease/exonuclease/phosphatase family protein [Dokdonella sp.]